MRVLTRLEARATGAYDSTYHHKLRGRLLDGVRDSPYDERHDAPVPMGFAFSNPFPPKDFDEGDERMFLVAAPEEELLAYIAADLLDERECNIGEMPFEVTDVSEVNPDVGEPGTSGVLESATGTCVTFDADDRERHGIDAPDGAEETYWQPEHTLEPFVKAVETNLDWKHGLYYPDHLPGPAEFDEPIFDSYEFIKTFAIPVTVTAGVKRTMVLSKWRLGYTVRDDHHRRHLNLALDCGIGERNGYGFGFLNDNLEEKEKRGA